MPKCFCDGKLDNWCPICHGNNEYLIEPLKRIVLGYSVSYLKLKDNFIAASLLLAYYRSHAPCFRTSHPTKEELDDALIAVLTDGEEENINPFLLNFCSSTKSKVVMIADYLNLTKLFFSSSWWNLFAREDNFVGFSYLDISEAANKHPISRALLTIFNVAEIHTNNPLISVLGNIGEELIKSALIECYRKEKL